MESDEQLRSFLLASAGTMSVPIANNLYWDKLGSPALSIKVNERKHFRDLIKEIKKTGVEFTPNSTFGPAFVPATNEIHIPNKAVTPGVLAHEWGHALNAATLKNLGGKSLQKAWLTLYDLGKPLSGLGTTAALAATGAGASEETLRNIGLAGVAVQTPRLIEELAASTRGAAKLKNLNMPGKLKTFVGIPTYALPLAAPMMPWLAKKLDPKLQELLNKKETE